MMMTATKCPTEAQLRALTLGQLAEDQSEALFDHIRTCEQCKSELETVEDTGDSLVSSLRQPDEHDAFEGELDCQVAVIKALGALAQAGGPASTTDLNSLPEKIGEYEIIRPLGRGGMGIVLLAQHTKLGRKVALKILSHSRLADPRMQQRFEAEMRAIGRLSHPNIVTAHDARDVDGAAVLVTEYVEGFDLGQLVARVGALRLADACEIARRVAVALEYTHGQGFVHRDIKPSNIMLSQVGEVKLLDLGLARLQVASGDQVELTGTGQAMGTADYIAPEQVNDSRSVDIRADIYALGCTFFKLLTGDAPFADERHVTAFAKMNAHISTHPPSLRQSLPDTPAALVELVNSMLAKEPERRPQSPHEVADRLSAFCVGHDLPELAGRAAASEAPPTSLSNSRPPGRASKQARPKLLPFMSRKVPLSVAIGAGFLGILAGLCLGILIIITNPDGTKSFLRLADGSSVEIREEIPDETSDRENSDESVVPAAELSQAPSSVNADEFIPGQPIPLSFVVLVNRSSNNRSPIASEADIVAATELLQRSAGDGSPVLTPEGTWYPMVEDLAVPIKAFNGGLAYALVSLDQRIGWTDIRGHVTGVTVAQEINAIFDESLGNRMRLLTRNNIRNQLAIIVNDRIRSAPFINSEIGNRVMITGVFDRGEAKQLMDWLTGGLVNPLAPPGADLPKPTDFFDALHASKSTGVNETPELRKYELEGGDPELAYQVVSQLLAGTPGVRLLQNANQKQLILMARPSEHKLVEDILAKLAGEVSDFHIIQLNKLDVELAIATINKFFGRDSQTDNADGQPVIDGNIPARQIWVKGTPAQVEQIRGLLDKLEENAAPKDEQHPPIP